MYHLPSISYVCTSQLWFHPTVYEYKYLPHRAPCLLPPSNSGNHTSDPNSIRPRHVLFVRSTWFLGPTFTLHMKSFDSSPQAPRSSHTKDASTFNVYPLPSRPPGASKSPPEVAHKVHATLKPSSFVLLRTPPSSLFSPPSSFFPPPSSLPLSLPRSSLLPPPSRFLPPPW